MDPLDRVGVRVPSDDVWHPERVACAGDGAVAAFVVGAARSGAKDQAGVWIGSVDGRPSRLTDEIPDTNLAFCADGSALAYALTADDRPQLVVRDTAGAVRQRHDLDAVPEVVAWAADGSLLVLLAEPGADTASLTSGKPLAGDVPPARSNRNPVGWRRVWRVDADTGDASALSPPDLTVWQFASLPDGRLVAVASTDPGEGGWHRPVLTLLGPDPSARQDLHVGSWQLSNPAVSPDGARVAFLEGWTSDRGLDTGDLRVLDLATGAITELGPTGVDATWLHWAPDRRLWFAGWRGLGTAWGWIDNPTGDSTGGDSQATPVVHPEVAGCINSRWHPQVVPLADGRALTVRSTESEPPEVSVVEPGGWSAWSDLNANVDRERGFVVREVRWAVDDVELEGLLVLPRGVEGPCPLVVDIHGGPSVAYHHSWSLTWSETVTAAGYALFLPNPFGGPGRGQGFARRNLGDPAGAEFSQILAGVRYLVDAGVADGERLAAMGASYGGYLTAWAVATAELFRGGVVIAGMSNLISSWGTANNAPCYEFLCDGTPDQARDLYLERSPVSAVSPRSLPALILHGELDQCVPVGQARELFTTLTEAGVEAQLVVYPGEGHQVHKIEHVHDQRERILAFLAEIF